ncbi:MAG: MBL fold metallo-hydrolase, partial [Chryseolinea sp.]
MPETKPRSFKRLKRVLVVAATIVILLFLVGYLYLRQDKFGQNPGGDRLALMRKSPHFKDGHFLNLSDTPEIAEGYTMAGVMYKYFFKGSQRKRPIDILVSVKNDLHAIPPDEDVLVWFGHSSYYIQIDGKRFLMDPVFSGNASPIPGTNTAFAGTDAYTVDDLPEIDYLIISHDHYDHTDYETLIALQPKTKHVICGLGVGSHFEHWGYSKDVIV